MPWRRRPRQQLGRSPFAVYWRLRVFCDDNFVFLARKAWFALGSLGSAPGGKLLIGAVAAAEEHAKHVVLAKV